jgi:hypothetical protein
MIQLVEDWDFPFRMGTNGPERFHQRKIDWTPLLGTVEPSGYVMVSWKGTSKRHFKRMHHIIWRLVHGQWPPEELEIDHINGDKQDNRIENLRLVTRGENIRFARARLGNWSRCLRKLSDAQMEETLSEYPVRKRTLKEMAKEFGVTPQHLANLRLMSRRQRDNMPAGRNPHEVQTHP